MIKYRMPPTWSAHVFLILVMYFSPNPIVLIGACWYIRKNELPPHARRTRTQGLPDSKFQSRVGILKKASRGDLLGSLG